MFRWGGLALRLSLIGAGSLLLVIAIAAAAIYFQRAGDVRASVSAPVPDQMTAVVELLEATPPASLPLVLRALNSSALRIRVSEQEPELPSNAATLPGVEWIVARYLDALGGRAVRVQLLPGEASATQGSTLLSARPVRIDVRLRDGRWASAEVRGELLDRAFGMPLAMGALIMTLVIGAVLLWAIRREVRPIEQLSVAAERFGTQLDATEVQERGSREVRGLIGAFNRMQGRIQTLVEGRTRLLAGVGHDVGTYLTRLRLRVDFISDPEQRAKAARDIGEMQALLADSLALARLDQRDAPAGEADLAAVVRAQAEAFVADGRTVRLAVAAEPLVVRGREVAMARLVANLISNALKYGAEAEVTAQRDGDAALLRVEDRGPGIPVAERERVLEPFFRLDSARNLDTPGSGLGLAIASDIVRRLGGTLTLGDRDGGGLSVSVHLQLSR